MIWHYLSFGYIPIIFLFIHSPSHQTGVYLYFRAIVSAMPLPKSIFPQIASWFCSLLLFTYLLKYYPIAWTFFPDKSILKRIPHPFLYSHLVFLRRIYYLHCIVIYNNLYLFILYYCPQKCKLHEEIKFLCFANFYITII